ncbi:MAG: hypothetical protein ACLRT5_00715 [Lachnospiraceae bacterium]
MSIERLLKRRFDLKYSTLVLLVMSILGFAIALILRLVDLFLCNVTIYTIICIALSFGFLLIALILILIYQKKYEKKTIYQILCLSPERYINNFLKIFAENSFKIFEYTEYISWFSGDMKRLYLDNEIHNKLVNQLYYGLRMDENGVCIASLHRNAFQKICKDIIENKNINIIPRFQEMKSQPVDTKITFSILVDKNIFFYFVLILVHLFGCLLISDNVKETFGNILICIPGDLVMIFIYKGIIRETNES